MDTPFYRRNYVVGLRRYAIFEASDGKRDVASQYFADCIALSKRLAKEVDTNEYYKYHEYYAIELEELAEFELASEKYDAARKYLKESLAIREEIAEGDPTPSNRSLYSFACNRLKKIEEELGHFNEAFLLSKKEIEIDIELSESKNKDDCTVEYRKECNAFENLFESLVYGIKIANLADKKEQLQQWQNELEDFKQLMGYEVIAHFEKQIQKREE